VEPAGAHYREGGGTTMSEALRIAQEGWVESVLGVQFDSGATTSPVHEFTDRWKQSYATWQDAIETVDKQMETLAKACRESEDLWLVNIANLGLPAVTGNYKTPLMAACLEASKTPSDKVAGAAAKARTAVANFAQHIATDPQVAGCDSNPFHVAVSIRATLGPALKSLNDTLRLAR
jgi:hypothetical protein